MPAWVCIRDTGLFQVLCITSNPAWCWWLWCGNCALPCACPRAAGLEGGSVPSCRMAGLGVEDLCFQQDRCLLSFLQNICSHALFWEAGNVALRARWGYGRPPGWCHERPAGCLACYWNAWKRCFLPGGCLGFPGNLPIAGQPVASPVILVTQTFAFPSLGVAQASCSEMVTLLWGKPSMLSFVHFYFFFFCLFWSVWCPHPTTLLWHPPNCSLLSRLGSVYAAFRRWYGSALVHQL